MEWLPALLTLLAFLGGLITYRNQKAEDRRHQLVLDRRSCYQEYLCAIADQAGHRARNSADELKLAHFAIVRNRMKLSCIASDEVIRSVFEFAKVSKMDGDGTAEKKTLIYKEALAKVIFDMREDCFDKSQITENDFLKMLPFAEK